MTLRQAIIRLAKEQPALRADLMPLIRKFADVMGRTRAEIKIKDGTSVPAGTHFKVEFIPERPARVLIQVEGRADPIRAKVFHLYKYLPGFTRPPNTATMTRWLNDGIAKTVTGKRTEPDGHGPDSSPSWLLALGFV